MVDVELLNAEIEDLGITKGKICEKCGISRVTLDKWLERPELITAKAARSIADALRITDEQKLIDIFFAPNPQINVSKEG